MGMRDRLARVGGADDRVLWLLPQSGRALGGSLNGFVTSPPGPGLASRRFLARSVAPSWAQLTVGVLPSLFLRPFKKP